MTLETVLRNVLRSSSAPTYDHLPLNQPPRYPAEKNGATADFHQSGYKKLKGKSKSDKKQAILSALMLLAFLFFLNVLQSCIREQNQNRGTVAMFGPTGATAPTAPTASNSHQSKVPARGKRSKPDSKESRQKRNILGQKAENINRKNLRSLLGLPHSEVREVGKANARNVHRLKFIRDFENVRNWTTQPSPVTDEDLKIQKTKTFKHLSFQENHTFVQERKHSFSSSSPAPTKETDHLYANPNKIPSRIKVVEKPENISRDINVSTNKRGISGELPVVTANRIALSSLDQRKEIWKNELKGEGQKRITSFFQTYFKYQIPGGKTSQRGNLKTPIYKQSLRRMLEDNAGNFFLPKNVSVTQRATTLRSRRSDHPSTSRAIIHEDYEEEGGGQIRDHGRFSPTTAVDLNLNTFQTFPVYKYCNHRPHVDFQEENQTSESEILKKQEILKRVHEEISKDSVDLPLFYPSMSTPSLSPPPNYEKMKLRQKYSNLYGNFPSGHKQTPKIRFRYSPYRQVSAQEESQFHEDYFRPLIFERYPQEQESGFDLSGLFWTALESFAKFLTNLVPPFAKENNEEPHCYNLLICEAQRVSKFMGPTAEALAATVGTLLTWASSEETRQAMADSISAGRVNTCQQQIKDCEDRSGGKSALTVIAQVMELKLR